MRAALPRACKLGGIRTIRWHALRHTFCTHLAMRGRAGKSNSGSRRPRLSHDDAEHLAPRVLDDAIGLLEKDVAWQKRGKENEKAANPNSDSRPSRVTPRCHSSRWIRRTAQHGWRSVQQPGISRIRRQHPFTTPTGLSRHCDSNSPWICRQSHSSKALCAFFPR